MADAPGPLFAQLNLVVADLPASLDFYRRLGLTPTATPDAAHAEASLPGGLTIEWDTAEFAAVWDSGSPGPLRGSIVLGFSVPSRQAVDHLYAELTAAGHHGRQPPYDAFWGSRYAIVDDPDGNGVGFMSPIEAERRYRPPTPASAS
ncbi:MAG: VOC family protein [Actinobacteria bacterium]|nr:VOC family protein [Actinomycetota bacterium]